MNDKKQISKDLEVLIAMRRVVIVLLAIAVICALYSYAQYAVR